MDSDQLTEGQRRQRFETIRQTVAGLVSTALLAPAMAMLHDSAFRDGPLAPGDAERRFAPLLEQQLADNVVSAAGLPIIDAVARRYAGIIGLRVDQADSKEAVNAVA